MRVSVFLFGGGGGVSCKVSTRSPLDPVLKEGCVFKLVPRNYSVLHYKVSTWNLAHAPPYSRRGDLGAG